MKRSIAVISLVLCLVLLCTACTTNVTFKEHYKDVTYEDYSPVLNKIEKISVLTGLQYQKSYGNLLALSDEVSTYFYNVDSEEIVLEIETKELRNYNFFSAGGHTFIITALKSEMESYQSEIAEKVEEEGVVSTAFVAALNKKGYKIVDTEIFYMIFAEIGEEEITYIINDDAFLQSLEAEGIIAKIGEAIPGEVIPGEAADGAPTEELTGLSNLPEVTIYDVSGNTVVSDNCAYGELLNLVSTCIDLFAFDNIIYRVAEDGTVSTVVSNPFFGGIPSIDYKIGEYYYAVTDSSVTVYDLALNTTLFWETPYEDCDDAIVAPLGGNVFVQTLLPLLDSEDNYDLILDEAKYKLNSYIINGKANKVTAVDLDYLIISTDASYLDDDRSSDKATIAMIEGNRVLTANSATKFVSINGATGNIDSVIFSDLYGTATMLVKDRFLYEMYNEDSYLIDANGTIIGKINTITDSSNARRNQSYIVMDGKVYDYNLQMVYDFSEEDLSVYGVMGHSLILQDQEFGFHLYTGDGTKKAMPEETYLARYTSQYYVLQKEGKYSIYNEEGTKLGSDLAGTAFNVLRSNRDMSVISVADTTDPLNPIAEYYKIFIAPVEE